MPGFYEFTCPHCKGKSAALDFGYGVMRDDDTTAWLGHPGEHRQIEKHGFTWTQAWLDGRIVLSDMMVCRDCGTIHAVNKLQPPRYVDPMPPQGVRGWTMWATVAVTLGVALYFNSILHGLPVGLVTFVLLEWLKHRRALKQAMSRTAAMLERWAKLLAPTACCGSCGGDRFTPVGNAIDDVADLRCPNCNSRGLSLHLAGIA